MKRKSLLPAILATAVIIITGCSQQTDIQSSNDSQTEQSTTLNVDKIEDALNAYISNELANSGSTIRLLSISNDNVFVVFTYNNGRNFPNECAAVVNAINNIADTSLLNYSYDVDKVDSNESLIARWGSNNIYMNFRTSEPEMKSKVTLDQLSELESAYQNAMSSTSKSSVTYKLLYGDFISSSGYDDIVVIKAKIKSSATDKMTIDQNYYNVCDLIKNQGLDTAGELQYWAVADMSDGSESKVISFTVDAATIAKIKSGEIVDNQLGNYVTDLWIHSSLQ